MSLEVPVAEIELRGLHAGSRLTLFPSRIVHSGQDAMETVPLAQLAAVGVGFRRDSRKLNWAIGLLVVALILAVISGPLREWMFSLASKLGEPGRREGLDAVLASVFGVIAAVARLMTPLALLLGAIATVLGAFFWLGATVLTLSFGASEREFSALGRNPQFVDFAHAVSEQLGVRKT